MSQISTLTKSIPEVDINQPICPFCNNRQSTVWESNDESENILYELCQCEEMRQFLYRRNQLRACNEELLIVEKKLYNDKRHAQRILKESGIGRRFLGAGFDNFKREVMPHAYDVAYNFATGFSQNNGNGLIFTGDVGTGKTHLAAAIAHHIIESYSVTVQFINYVDLIADLKAAFSSDTGNVVQIEKRMCESNLLIIDDLGKEKQSQFTNELLYRVVNRRYKDNLPLIITTNYRLPVLAERLDYAVFSRIIGICKAVDMRGTDYRVKDYLE